MTLRRLGTAQPELVTSFDGWRVLDQLASSATTILQADDIQVVRLERSGQVILAVASQDRARALAAFHKAELARQWWLCGEDAVPRQMVNTTVLSVKGNDLALYRVLAGPGGDSVGAEDLCVRLQFWAPVGGKPRLDGGTFEKGTRIAPTRNGVAPYLTATMWSDAQEADGHRFASGRGPHLLDMHEPIDIVYTWVDGSDPVWLERRRSTAVPDDRLSADALDPARTTDREELRYSLRSVAMYASWVRRIWLVTDGQVPAWLADHPKVSIVDHRELFTDLTALPTFNSHAIESQLHHIPGLAEHFLYLNDDVFFGRPVRPEQFFHGNGIAKIMISPVALGRDPSPGRLNGAAHAARQNRAFLEASVGRTVTHRLQHVPHAHVKRSLDQLEDLHPDLVSAVARSRFRSSEDVSIASDLGHYHAYAHGDAVTGTLSFRYIDIGSPLAREHFDHLLDARDQDSFCLNDVGGYVHPVDNAAVVAFMSRYFPVPSPFERAPDQAATA